MRRKRFQKGSLQSRKHGKHRVWVAFWYEDGERCRTLGTSFAVVEVGGRSSTLLSASGNQQRHQQDDEAGICVQAFCGGRVLAVPPSQLEGIDCGHIGADDQLTPDPRVWKTSAPRNSEGRPARLPRTKSGGSFCQRGCSSVSVRATQVQARAAAQRAGVSAASSDRLRRAMPGSTACRYSFTGTPNLRQDSTAERIAATLGPACALPTCSQFLRLCTRAHNRNYARAVIMCSPPLGAAA
jgi:hypothetical protein